MELRVSSVTRSRAVLAVRLLQARDLVSEGADVAEISRRRYEEIRSSRDPRDHVEDG